MESTRQNKIARLIQKDLSTIFQAQTRKTRGVLVSVSIVRVSPDLSVAKAYLSIYPSARAQEILDNINAQTSQIRYELGMLERHQLRIIPELKFFIRSSFILERSSSVTTSSPSLPGPEFHGLLQYFIFSYAII